MTLPGLHNIQVACRLYEELKSWKLVNNVISSYVYDHPQNTDEHVVVTKVVLINSLYNANVREPLRMVEHILGSHRLDTQLEAGEVKAVVDLAESDRNYVSFASKYCHFHNKTVYPICDSYVKGALKLLQGGRTRLNSYDEFYETISTFRNSSGLTSVSWEELDRYLWLYGQKKALDIGKNAIGKEVKALYHRPDGHLLFERLEP